MCRYKSLFPKFSSALLRSNKYGELFVLLSTAKEALGRVFLQPPAKMDVATVELSTRRHRKLQEHLEAMALPFGEAMRLVAERRAKKQKKAKGKRGRGDSKTKEVGLLSKSFQHGEIVVDVDALIEYVGVSPVRVALCLPYAVYLAGLHSLCSRSSVKLMRFVPLLCAPPGMSFSRTAGSLP